MVRELWVEEFYVIVLLRVVAGALLSLRQIRLLRVIATSRVASTGILLICLKTEVFRIYFLRYRMSVACVLLRVLYCDSMMAFFGVLSLIGLPLLPIFIPKLQVLMFLIEISLISAIIVLLRFMVSSLYYVKFLIPGGMKWSAAGITTAARLVRVSVISCI